MINSSSPKYLNFLAKFQENYGFVIHPTEREFECYLMNTDTIADDDLYDDGYREGYGDGYADGCDSIDKD